MLNSKEQGWQHVINEGSIFISDALSGLKQITHRFVARYNQTDTPSPSLRAGW